MELATRDVHSGYDNNCHYHIIRRHLADAYSSEGRLLTIDSYGDALAIVTSDDEANIPGFLDQIERVGYVVLPDATYVAIVDCTSTECPWVCEVIADDPNNDGERSVIYHGRNEHRAEEVYMRAYYACEHPEAIGFDVPQHLFCETHKE